MPGGMEEYIQLQNKKNMRLLFIIVIGVLFYACSSRSTIEVDMGTEQVESLVGLADSIQDKDGIPDVYTNKLIKMETWYYGNDTIVNFANEKVQSVLIR